MSSLWALGRVLSRGGQSSFVGGCGGPFSSMAGFRGLGVIVCGWCVWSLMAVVIAWVHSWPVAVLVLSLLEGRGCLPWFGDGFVVGRRVVVAVGGVIGVVVVVGRKRQRHTL